MSYKISIPQPCHEDWNLMTQKTNGRHCEACKTVVTDFTLMSDAEIIKHLKATAGKTCGRFSANQLNRELIQERKNGSWFGFVKFSAAASILLSLLQISAMAQSKKEVKVEQKAMDDSNLKPNFDAIKEGTQSLAIDSITVNNLIGTHTKGVMDIDSYQKRDSSLPLKPLKKIIPSREESTSEVSLITTPWQRFKQKIRRLF